MIFVHSLPASDAPYSFLLDVSEDGGDWKVTDALIAAIPAGERSLSTKYARWIVQSPALEDVFAVAKAKATSVRYVVPPQPGLVWPYKGW